MADEKKKIKTIPIEKLLFDHFGKKIFKIKIKSNGHQNTDYMIINEDGFELFLATKKVVGDIEVLDVVRSIKDYKWIEFKSVKVDKFALSTLYEFDNGLILLVETFSDLTKSLQAHDIEVHFIDRKWFNKIIGYRSKKKWKMVLTSLVYISILIMALNVFIESDTEKAEMAAAQATEESEERKKQEVRKAEEAVLEKEREAKKEKEAALEKKEQEKKLAAITAFRLASDQLIEESKGIIPDITIEDAGGYLQVKVFVDEATWARSNESEKISFATTVGTSIENILAPNSTYVDIMSATNKDTVATQKMFGGWKIKR